MQHGSEQLREWLKRRGVNQREASVLLGIHFTTLNKILLGVRLPSIGKAVLIEAKTGIPVGAWTSRVGKTKKRQSAKGQNSQHWQAGNAHAR